MRLSANSSITARQPVSDHSRSNTKPGPSRRTAAVGSSRAAVSTMAWVANRAPERSSRAICPLASELVQAPKGGDHPLADLAVHPPALGDLEIDTPTEVFLRKYIGPPA